jgi:hypothetical protein
VRTDVGLTRRSVVVLGSIAILATGVVIARGSAASTDSGPRAPSGALPSAIAGSDPAPTATSVGLGGPSLGNRAAVIAAGQRHTRLPAVKPGVPIALTIAIRTPTHPHGVHSRVKAHALNPDGTLYVPADPQTVSWAKEDAPPGASHGTTILTSHINYVIGGHLVIGALSDLAWYARHAIGRQLTLRMADGRVFKYRIVAGREYSKDQLANNPKLRATLYDQRKVYGPAGHTSARLLLVSCGGAFDAYTGEYEDNVFLYALPIR